MENKILLLTYEFFLNTTSVNRYRELVNALIKKDIAFEVVDFNLIKKRNTIYCDIDNKDYINESINSKVISFSPKLGLIQNLVVKIDSKYLNFIYYFAFKEEPITPKDYSLANLITYRDYRGYVVVSGGPYGVFKYAYKLSKKFGFKLVLDYRDPWTYGYTNINGFKLAYKIRSWFLKNIETKLLRQASLITTVSETLKSYFPSEFQHKIHVIPNGSNYAVSELQQKADKTFNIVYTGTIYNDQLQDDTFFMALKQFLDNKDQKNIRLQFLGSFYTTILREKIEQFGLSEITTITKRLKKGELLPYLNNANIFLHLKYGDRSGIITSKQADYLFFRKPILLPVSDKGDLAESISKHKAGYICNDQAEIVGTLNMLYSKFLNGEVVEIVQSEEMLKHNSREAIAERFVELILENK